MELRRQYDGRLFRNEGDAAKVIVHGMISTLRQCVSVAMESVWCTTIRGREVSFTSHAFFPSQKGLGIVLAPGIDHLEERIIFFEESPANHDQKHITVAGPEQVE